MLFFKIKAFYGEFFMINECNSMDYTRNVSLICIQLIKNVFLKELRYSDTITICFSAAFFILGGVCVSFGGASYIGSLFTLRRLMLLSVPALLLQGAVVSSVALFWLCAVSLYIGRLEVEIIHEDEDGEDEGECRECRERREHRPYRSSEDTDRKGPNK